MPLFPELREQRRPIAGVIRLRSMIRSPRILAIAPCRGNASRTATRLTNLIAVLCIIGWRVFQLSMVNRTNPKSAASEVFTDDELELLDRLSGSKRRAAKRPIARYVIAVAS